MNLAFRNIISSCSRRNLLKNNKSSAILWSNQIYNFSSAQPQPQPQPSENNQIKQQPKILTAQEKLIAIRKSLAHFAQVQIKYEKLNKPNLNQLTQSLKTQGWKITPQIRHGTKIQFSKQLEQSFPFYPVYQIKIMYQAKPPGNQFQEDNFQYLKSQYESFDTQSLQKGLNQMKKGFQKFKIQTNFQPQKKEKIYQKIMQPDSFKNFHQLSVYIKAKNQSKKQQSDQNNDEDSIGIQKKIYPNKWMKLNIIIKNQAKDFNQSLFSKEDEKSSFICTVYPQKISFISDINKQLQQKTKHDQGGVQLNKLDNTALLKQIIQFIQNHLKLDGELFAKIHDYAQKYQHKYYVEWLENIKNICKL